MAPEVYTIIGILIPITIFISTVVFRTGHITARLEELERWRISIRQDMHEISDKLESNTTALKQLTTMIEERTERRLVKRDD